MGKLVAFYDYDAFGNCTVYDENGVVNTDPNFIGNINPFRWKSQYFDVESGLYYINGNFFDPKSGQYVNHLQYSTLFDKILQSKGLDRSGISWDNIFTVSAEQRNSPISIVSSAVKIGTVAKTLLDAVQLVTDARAMCKEYKQLTSLTKYFFTELRFDVFCDDVKLSGGSVTKGFLQLAGFTWRLKSSDIFGVVLSVGFDVCDSLIREVSPQGIIVGVALTFLEGIVLLYISKGIVYISTAVGGIFGAQWAAVGFVIGTLISLVVDWHLKKWVDELIDDIAS